MKITTHKVSGFLILSLFIACTHSEQVVEDVSSEEIASPSSANASLPHLTVGANEKLYLSWVEEKDSSTTAFYYAEWQDTLWSEPELIAKGNDWFVNWADYPMIAIDQDGNKMAHYLSKSSGGTYSYDVQIVIQKKDSLNWSSAITPHSDDTPTEHGFVTMLPTGNDSFTVAWLDGRKTSSGSHDEHGHGGSMTLRSAKVGLDGTISEEVELDGRVCDCCQTGGVMTEHGLLIVYRDRSVDEVRDMAFVTQYESEWAEPRLIAEDNWKIAGCPVNGPRVASAGNTIAAAWYTGALDRPKIKVAFSSGNKFEQPITIDDTSPIGRVDIVIMDNDEAIVSWLDGGKQPAIKYRKVNRDGSMSNVYLLAQTSKERASGFPQMEIYQNTIYFAWTEIGDKDQIRLKKATLGQKIK